jgi:hypothetical protein
MSRAEPSRADHPLGLDEACAGMTRFDVTLAAEDVVLVKSILQAYDGLAAVFAERGGELALATPPSRARELEGVLQDLELELGPRLWRTRRVGDPTHE